LTRTTNVVQSFHGLQGCPQGGNRRTKAGDIRHEARDDANDKNLLETGAVTPAEVIALLQACRGDQYKSDKHHDLTIKLDVHIFKPEKNKVRWYIKLYFIEPNVVFISVHK
jgi:hypothetical protein